MPIFIHLFEGDLMKSMLLTIILTAFLLPGAVSAQIDQGVDGIGLYADSGAMTNNIMAEPGDIFEVYIMATNISNPEGIQAFELSLSSPQLHVQLLSLVLNNADIIVTTFPDIMVGCSPLKETAPVIELARVLVMVTDAAPAELYIGPGIIIEGGSAGHYLPGYVDSSSSVIYDMYPSSGSIDAPVFRINGEAPVATTSVSFDHVKSLYR